MHCQAATTVLACRYTQDSVAAVKRAQREASKLGKNFVGPEHLLLGILAVNPEEKGERPGPVVPSGAQRGPAGGPLAAPRFQLGLRLSAG